MKCIDSSEISRLITGQLDADRVAALKHHSLHCEKCAAAQQEMKDMTGRLAPDSGEFSDHDFAGDVMTLIRLGQAKQKDIRPSWWSAITGRWQTWLPVPLVAAATAVLVLFVWPQTDSLHPPFQARGGGKNPDSWVSIKAYRAAGSNHEVVSDTLRLDDAVAFSYSNRSEVQYGFLMVFAVDQSGRVFWYYPAHVRHTDNPKSIGITVSEAPQTLSQQVRHEFSPGKLRIFGLFSKAPLDVLAVESMISRDLAAAGTIEKLSRLNIGKTGQHSFLVDVTSGHDPNRQP